MDFTELDQNFGTEDRAREFLERTLWPNGAVCPHCGSLGKAYKLTPKPGKRSHVRPGVWKCKICRKQFSVKVGTIFEKSHLPLRKWLIAIRMLNTNAKRMNAGQLHRALGITYKTAWSLTQRIQRASALNRVARGDPLPRPEDSEGEIDLAWLSSLALYMIREAT